MTEHTTIRQRLNNTTRRADSDNDGDAGVEIVGERRLSFDPTNVTDLPLVERECTVACASGDRTTAQWAGVDVFELLDRAEANAETTHLLVVSDDGYRACVALDDARSALLAVGRDGQPLDTAEAYGSRFVGPSIDGERAVKGVVRIEAVVLSPEADSTELERLSLDNPAYG